MNLIHNQIPIFPNILQSKTREEKKKILRNDLLVEGGKNERKSEPHRR